MAPHGAVGGGLVSDPCRPRARPNTPPPPRWFGIRLWKFHDFSPHKNPFPKMKKMRPGRKAEEERGGRCPRSPFPVAGTLSLSVRTAGRVSNANRRRGGGRCLRGAWARVRAADTASLRVSVVSPRADLAQTDPVLSDFLGKRPFHTSESQPRYSRAPSHLREGRPVGGRFPLLGDQRVN